MKPYHIRPDYLALLMLAVIAWTVSDFCDRAIAIMDAQSASVPVCTDPWVPGYVPDTYTEPQVLREIERRK